MRYAMKDRWGNVRRRKAWESYGEAKAAYEVELPSIAIELGSDWEGWSLIFR